MDSQTTAPQALTPTPQNNIVLTSGPEALLSQAISAGASIDTLERLMALRKDVLAEQAKQAFNDAMAAFQEECPVIDKTKAVHTKSGALAYKYAPIESIISQIKPIVRKHGFRYTTTMEFKGDTVRVSCRVVHSLGHEEVSVMEVPLGGQTPVMSQSQVVAAASTFAKRYAFLNAFGIMTGDEDNDTASERGDQKQKAPEKADAPQNPAKPDRKPGEPFYDPQSDDGNSMTPKQRAFLTKRWGIYMEKSGVDKDSDRATALDKFIPWAFQKFQKTATMDTLSVSQASYLIDLIPTLPISTPKKATVPPPSTETPPAPPPAPPAPTVQRPEAPKKPSPLTKSEIADIHESLRQAPDVESLEATWKTVIEKKQEGRLDNQFIPLHQTYVKVRLELKNHA